MTSPGPPPPWPRHAGDELVIATNVANIDAEVQAAQGHREQFTLAVPLEWHTRIHEGCTNVPVEYYVGHYRGEKYVHLLKTDVRFAHFNGASAGEVAARLAQLEVQIQATLTRFDAEMTSSVEATTPRLNKLIDELAKHYAGWLRIHPFIDGNGRTARILVNWVLARYWQPLILPGRPPTDKTSLVAATTPALADKGADYRPLGTHLRNRLRTQRKAAMEAAAAAPAPPPEAL